VNFSAFSFGSEMSASDKAYVAQVVAARTGLSEQEADKRVTDVTAQLKSDLDKARKSNSATCVLACCVSLDRSVLSSFGCYRRRRPS
jgi:hypothetical protein